MNNKLVFLNDKVAKKLFKNENCGKEFSARVISDVIGLDYDYVLNNLSISTDEIAFSSLTLNSTADAIYYNDMYYFDIEVNYHNTRSKNEQLASYCYQLYLGQLHTYKDYNKIKKITQISIDSFDYFGYDDFIYNVYLMEEKHHLKESDMIHKIHINLAKLRKEEYTKVIDGTDRLKKDLFFFTCNDKEKINEVYKGDKLMEKVYDEANQIAGNQEMNLYFSDEELIEMDKKHYIRENLKQVISNMIKLNMPIDTISKVTDLSIPEVETIIKELETK